MLLLPREIRDEVLEAALHPGDLYFTIRSGRYCGLPASLLLPISVQLLRVNRQLYWEGKEILQKLYSQRPFVFRISGRSIIDFLKSLPEDDRDAIRSVCLPEECYTYDDWGNREAWNARASSGRLNMYSIFDGTLLRLTTISFFISRSIMRMGTRHNAVNQEDLAKALHEGSLITVNFVSSIMDITCNMSLNRGMWKLTNAACCSPRFEAITPNIGVEHPLNGSYDSVSEIDGLKGLSFVELKQILRSRWKTQAHPIDSDPIGVFTVRRSQI